MWRIPLAQWSALKTARWRQSSPRPPSSRSRRPRVSGWRCMAPGGSRWVWRNRPQAITDQWPFDPRTTVGEWAAAEGDEPGFPGFHSDQLRDFARAVLDDCEPTVTGLDAYRALEVVKGVYLSQTRRRPISLPMSAADRAEAHRITSGIPS